MTRPLAALLLVLAAPAFATLEDDTTPQAYSGLCQMTQTCHESGACGFTPGVGELLLQQDALGTQMGRNVDDLSPIEHFQALEPALEITEIEGFRRTFLVNLPPEGRTRRFAVHVQTLHPETGAPVLRPQYFVLECLAL